MNRFRPPALIAAWFGTRSATATGVVWLTLAGWPGVPARAAVNPTEPASVPEVAVVYNLNLAPDSRLVAEHYASRRQIPAQHVIGLPLPTQESMTRAEYETQLQQPLIEQLEQRGLISYHKELIPATETEPGRVLRLPIRSRIRYLVVCYGVPLRILNDATRVEATSTNLEAHVRKNGAAVDNELALLPQADRRPPLTGHQRNPFYGTTNLAQIHPTKGLLMVARLDGPSSAIARRLVDQALAAETNGFWGRAYFDARGITNGAYATGDEWIQQAFAVARRQGFESMLDVQPATFSACVPFPQIALYAGWYTGAPSGPFARKEVEFMPGAFAYHLFSYSASTVRSAKSWVGAFLAKGATTTIGYVDEPFIHGTVNLGILFSRLLEQGATYGEAAYASQIVLSWQTTVIGDPLYRPFGRPPQALHAALETARSPLLEWSHLRVVNLNLAGGDPPNELASYLLGLPITDRSAILTQKRGDLYVMLGGLEAAAAEYQKALKLKPTPQQKAQLHMVLARLFTQLKRESEALETYDAFLRDQEDCADLVPIYRSALNLAEKLKRSRLVQRYQREIERLTPPPPAPADPKAGPKS